MSSLDNSGEELSDCEENVIPFSGKQVPKTPGRESPKSTLDCANLNAQSHAEDLYVFWNPYYQEAGQNQEVQNEGNHQEVQNVDQPTSADGDGGNCDNVVSPCASSQESVGSTDSAESLFTAVENLKQSSERVKQGLTDLDIVLPKLEQKILESYCRDQAFLVRLHKFLCTDFKSFCISSGLRDSEDCKSLLAKFEQKDLALLLARFGKLFLEKYIENKEQNDARRNENSGSSNVVDSIIFMPEAPFDTAQNEPDTPDSQYEAAVVTDPGNNDFPNLAPVPNFENSNNERLKRKEESLYFPGEVLEKANDHVVRNNGSRKLQIEKAGQVLFDYIFTDCDIMNCNVSGKKGKQAFEEAKVRHLNRTLIWLIKRQSQTSVEERGLPIYEAHAHHIDHIAQNDLRLEPSDESHFKKAVLVEHAYRRREKLKKEVQTYTEELD